MLVNLNPPGLRRPEYNQRHETDIAIVYDLVDFYQRPQLRQVEARHKLILLSSTMLETDGGVQELTQVSHPLRFLLEPVDHGGLVAR